MIKTVLGKIEEKELGITLAHEHIACYYEPIYQALGESYLDKERLAEISAEHLKNIKERFGVGTVIDCTPLNIGRDITLLKKVSKKSGVNIICSTGFYYTEEPMLFETDKEKLVELILEDIEKNNVGVIKFALQTDEMSDYTKRIFSALCETQTKTALPLIIHTNYQNKSAKAALDFALNHGVSPASLTIGHLSDCEDIDCVLEILESGCFAGFDRIYNPSHDRYHPYMARYLLKLFEKGYSERIILSQDASVFNGFQKDCSIKEKNPFDTIFTRLIPEMKKIGFDEKEIKLLLEDNPKNMLLCK